MFYLPESENITAEYIRRLAFLEKNVTSIETRVAKLEKAIIEAGQQLVGLDDDVAAIQDAVELKSSVSVTVDPGTLQATIITVDDVAYDVPQQSGYMPVKGRGTIGLSSEKYNIEWSFNGTVLNIIPDKDFGEFTILPGWVAVFSITLQGDVPAFGTDKYTGFVSWIDSNNVPKIAKIDISFPGIGTTALLSMTVRNMTTGASVSINGKEFKEMALTPVSFANN